MRWEIDPFFIVVIECIVQVEPGRRSGYADVDAIVVDKLPDERVYFCNVTLVNECVRRSEIRLIVDNNFVADLFKFLIKLG